MQSEQAPCPDVAIMAQDVFLWIAELSEGSLISRVNKQKFKHNLAQPPWLLERFADAGLSPPASAAVGCIAFQPSSSGSENGSRTADS